LCGDWQGVKNVKIYVINLDRRPDRWEKVQKSAISMGIKLNRISAADGRFAPHRDHYKAYLQLPYVKMPKKLSINSNYQLYRNYHSDMSRVAYIENRNQSKAIGSPGAWGYLVTMIFVLEDALNNEYEQILVLDDDAIFHKQFNLLFNRIIHQVPKEWMLLQLGALQYHWEEKWMEWYSDNLYMCKGCSLGSHAVGMHRSVIPLVLNYCQRFDLPYDEGPLHKPKALYPDKCLTFFPNLIIQDVSESEISDKTNQKNVMSKRDNIYRWDVAQYVQE
jgi:GR25 family glycosyltransferase involved in LPS biosynthesis